MKRFTVKGWAASELDIRAEVTAIGDRDYGLLAAWDGKAICAFTREGMESMADQATELANAIDLALHEGEVPQEERRIQSNAARGLWGLAGRLRKACAA